MTGDLKEKSIVIQEKNCEDRKGADKVVLNENNSAENTSGHSEHSKIPQGNESGENSKENMKNKTVTGIHIA